MTRKRARNREGFRFCNKCDSEFPLTKEHFHSDKNRKCGFSYRCIHCSYKPDLRKNRWAEMTDEQKDSKREWQRVYAIDAGKPSHRVASYRSIDKSHKRECDLTTDWYKDNIHGKSCVYCDDDVSAIGCDRIDNSIGHTKSNVVPSCRDCNTARMDNFTHAEMFLIGAAIKQIKQDRSKGNVNEPVAS